MNQTRRCVIVLLVLCSGLSCQFTQTKTGNSEAEKTSTAETSTPSSTTNPNTFNGSMKDLQEILTTLLPKIVDINQYNAPENKKLIQDDVKKLILLSKNVSHSPSVSLKDPSVTFISQAFTEDLMKIDESLALGKRDFARYNLMNLPAYCIECHTRTSTGPSFRSPALDSALKKMSGLERGEYLLATRQFDAALKEFSNFIDERLSKKNDFFSLDKAVRHALSITVKYLKDPKKSLVIAEKVKNSKATPYYLRQNAVGWETAIQDWMKEKSPEDNTVAAILKRCREWITKAQQMSVGLVDRGGDIYFLRALSDLHQVLTSKLTPDQLGEALYLTGLSYEAVKDLPPSSLHEDYYESCVRKVPHSSWSAKCFKRYEESVYFGYTGSSGVRLPEDEAKRLEVLRGLAFEPGQ
jgi:hypothetical protein